MDTDSAFGWLADTVMSVDIHRGRRIVGLVEVDKVWLHSHGAHLRVCAFKLPGDARPILAFRSILLQTLLLNALQILEHEGSGAGRSASTLSIAILLGRGG